MYVGTSIDIPTPCGYGRQVSGWFSLSISHVEGAICISTTTFRWVYIHILKWKHRERKRAFTGYINILSFFDRMLTNETKRKYAAWSVTHNKSTMCVRPRSYVCMYVHYIPTTTYSYPHNICICIVCMYYSWPWWSTRLRISMLTCWWMDIRCFRCNISAHK